MMVDRYNCYGWDIRRGEMRREEDGNFVRYYDYAALEEKLAYWQSQHDERTRQLGAEATPPVPKVTEVMVERACRVHNVGWSLWKEPQKKTAREVMYAALTAAQESGQ